MYFLIIFAATFYGYGHSCPPEKNIEPCDCRTILNSDVMACAYLLNPDELIKPITTVAETGSAIEILTIVNSTLLYIPNSIFKFTKFEKIHFINSEIMSLSDTDTAFEGLENSLIELRATKSQYVAHWDWQQLRNLQALDLIDVSNMELGSISMRFPELKNLKFLGIINAGISFIVQYAFAGLKKLTVLNMKENYISELNRNMFPEPAHELITIDFSKNQLSHLPTNIFRNMPNLEQVILEDNKFTTLDRDVFTWALHHLYELAMHGNKFVCDCRIKWMVGGHVPVRFNGQCDSPENLKGKQLRHLQFEDAKC